MQIVDFDYYWAFSFLFSTPDTSGNTTRYIIAGTVVGGVLLIMIVVSLTLIVLYKYRNNLKLKKHCADKITETATSLYQMGKTVEEVKAATESLRKILRTQTDEAGEEDRMHKVLSDFVSYMNEELTAELTKLTKK